MTRVSATGFLPAGLAIIIGFLPLSGIAQDAPPGGDEEQLIQALFESETRKELDQAIASARKSGIPEQAILEARFLFLVDQEDFAAVAALGPVLEKQKPSFRIDDSIIFSVAEEFFSIIEYCSALEALEKGDAERFKTHITEAFWLSPRQATAFAPHIDRLRRDQALAKLRIDFDRSFMRQKDGQKVALQVLARQSDHLVIHFWSPWSTESEDHLPDFLAMVKELSSHGIPVASVLIEPGKEALAEAKKFRAAITAETAEVWIVDNSRESLARKLRVLELPTITVLKVDGSVLFSGHPSEKKLWSTLQSINPELSRPRVKLIP